MNDFRNSDSTPPFNIIVDASIARLKSNQRVRRTLPCDGRLRIDRQLPFLCVYRSPGRSDEGTRELVTSEAAYLYASGDKEHSSEINTLIERLSFLVRDHFGAFLVIEVWSDSTIFKDSPRLGPGFEIVTSDLSRIPTAIDAMKAAFSEIVISGHSAEVSTREVTRVCPPDLSPLSIGQGEAAHAGCVQIGLAVRPIFQDSRLSKLFPMVLEALRPQFARALRKTVAKFTGKGSNSTLPHYDTYGPSSLVKASRIVDQQLCEVSETFDFLLQVTPTNADEAWSTFQKSKYRDEPFFHYRSLPYHPALLKRRLFEIEVERVEDPVLAQLFREKQNEIDTQLTSLRLLNTSKFLLTSLQQHGGPDPALTTIAENILRLNPEPDSDDDCGESLPVAEIVRRAREEIDYYHGQLAGFNATIEVRDDIAAGIMVSHGRLLISNSLHLSNDRIQPLLNHEIGTHLLTYFNGQHQPFRQLYAGLAGYEELQEGLAVLAEFLTGGLTINRLRTLASRVIAIRSMTDGNDFRKTFHLLYREYGFSPRQSFMTTLRAFRGGGLTKDVIYLRGLRDLLEYLSGGHDIEPLYIGKFGLHHIPYIQELRRRGIVHPPSILPRFWKQTGFQERLNACRKLSVVELLERTV